MRCALLLMMLSLTACGVESPDGSTIEAPEVSSSDLAAPVTAPMAARERLLHEMDVQNEAARQRSRDLDAIMNGNR